MNFILIISFIFLGWALKRQGLLTESRSHWLNQYAINLCLPAIILLSLPKITFNLSHLIPMVTPWLLIIVIVPTLSWISKKYNIAHATQGCLLIVACFGNTSFLGFPIIQAFYGSQGLAYAALYDQIGTMLSLAILGNIFIAFYSRPQPECKENEHCKADSNDIVSVPNNAPQTRISHIVLRVLKFPPFVAVIVSLFLTEQAIPSLIRELFGYVSLTLVPATMLVVGFHFSLRLPTGYGQSLVGVLSLKMLLSPVLVFFALYGYQNIVSTNFLSPSFNMISKVTIMESAMPPMVTASIMAIHAKLAPKLAAAAVGYGLILAMVTMPMIYLITQ